MANRRAVIIRTERLILRKKEEKDIPYMLDLFNDDDVTRCLGGYPPKTASAMHKMIRYARSTEWAVALENTDEYIGECTLLKTVDDYLGEIGYYFRRGYWNQGYAKEAVQAMIAYCRDTLHLKRLCATIDDENGRSKRFIEKLGFQFVALLPEADFGGRVADVAYYTCVL